MLIKQLQLGGNLRAVFCVAGFLLALLSSVSAEPATAPVANSKPNIVYPSLLNRDSLPLLPHERDNEFLEGWVELYFDVLADGTVVSPSVADGFHEDALSQEAIAWIEKQGYQPGTVDGRPQVFHWHESIPFALRGRMRWVVEGYNSPKFRSALKRIKKMLKEKQFKQAREKIDAYEGSEALLLAEFCALEVTRYIAELGLGNERSALRAIYVATVEHVTALDGKELTNALVKRFIVEARLGEYRDALSTAERLRKLQALDTNDYVSAMVENIRSTLSSRSAIEISAVVKDFAVHWNASAALQGDTGLWDHDLARSRFTIDHVKGKIRGFNVYCPLGKVDVPYQEDMTWTINDSWGDCMVIVEGAVGTTFDFYELPNESAKPAKNSFIEQPSAN